jgi:hypothetical protein
MMQRVKIEALDTLIAKLGTKPERKWKRKKQRRLVCHLLDLHFFGLVMD